MHTVFALLCFVVVIHWLIFPYPSGLLHWHCGNLTIAPVPAKQPWWIWINTSCEFIMNDCITTTKQSTTKPFAYFLGYTVLSGVFNWRNRLTKLLIDMCISDFKNGYFHFPIFHFIAKRILHIRTMQILWYLADRKIWNSYMGHETRFHILFHMIKILIRANVCYCLFSLDKQITHGFRLFFDCDKSLFNHVPISCILYMLGRLKMPVKSCHQTKCWRCQCKRNPILITVVKFYWLNQILIITHNLFHPAVGTILYVICVITY